MKGQNGQIDKIRKQLISENINNIELKEYRKSIVLDGDLNDYQRVVRAGKIAAKYGYKGVVNHIAVKNISAPKIIRPEIKDNAIDGTKCDVLIIGGGVIGCSIAREISKYHLKTVLVEKESDVAMQASSRNDGMIHPGIGTHLHSNTGPYNVRGNAMYGQLCEELDIPFRRPGNLIVFENKNYHMFAPLFQLRAKQLGMPIEHLSKKKLKELEPNIMDSQAGGFICPTSGVLSPYKLTVALAENAIENGVVISLSTVVDEIISNNGKIMQVKTNRGTIYPRVVINAAGVFSDKIAQMAGDEFFTIHPRKGEIIIADKKKGHLFTTSIGEFNLKATKGDTKGGGLVRTIDDNILIGPNAYEVIDREDYSTSKSGIDALFTKQSRLIKGITRADAITYFAGVRAPTYEENFIIEASENVDNLVHAAGIQSPGLASAPAIAQDIVMIAKTILEKESKVLANDKFNPKRKTINIHDLSLDQKQKLIKSNPDYGIIVCRCEEISKGEILDALNSPLPVYTLDGIKRRVRPGMGRCQGGFCSPLVTKLIAQQSGMDITEVTKNGEKTNVLLEKTHKGGEQYV